MQKTVIVPKSVDDLTGLLIELRRSSFSALNVGADRNFTYVHLEPHEEKDPTPIVESWVGRTPPSARDKKAFQQRLMDMKEIVSPPPPPSVAPPPEEPSGDGFVRRLFRRLMG